MTAIDIPGYLIRREIGSGGMASVYLALQTSLERDVALKVMAPGLAADPSFSKRFLQEARMLASLAHPNIVQVYDVGVTQAQLNYFSMQYLPGGDFAHRVAEGISEKDLVRVLEGVANALGYAHQRGYVHRDVAPGNILFDINDTPLLTDFGIARAITQAARITSAGISIGTSHYMSPEQARGGDVDARSDLYGLGVLTWFGLTGKPPYEGADGFAVSYAHVFEPIPRLPAAQARWQPIIDKALAKDPAERYQDADEFVAALAAIDVRASIASQADAEAPTRIMRRDASAPAAVPVAAEAPTRIGAIPTLEQSAASNTSRSTARAGARWIPWGAAVIGIVLLSLVGYLMLSGPEPASTGKSAQSTLPVSADRTVKTGSTPDSDAPAPAPASTPLQDPEVVEAPMEDALSQDEEPLDLANVPTVIDPVVELVRLARIDLTAQRLTSPPRNNAFERFGLALRIDPKEAKAKQGIVDTATAYRELAEKSWSTGNVAEFVAYLDKLEDVASTVPEGTALITTAKSRRAREAEAFLTQAEEAAANWDKPAAKAAYEKILILEPTNSKVRTAMQAVDRIGAPGFVFRDKLSGGSAPEFVVVNASLAVARRETTRGDFSRWWRAAGQRQFAGKDVSCRDRESVFRSSRKRNWQAPDIVQDDSHPVVCVSFAHATAYAAWLSTESGQRYRLPTPSEWERLAGQRSAGNCTTANLADASYKRSFESRAGAECDDGHSATAPSGSFPAVAGIFDIDGNVREWVAACGKSSPLTSGCREHAVRGRGWLSVADKESVTQVDSYGDDVAVNTVGFRLVRELGN